MTFLHVNDKCHFYKLVRIFKRQSFPSNYVEWIFFQPNLMENYVLWNLGIVNTFHLLFLLNCDEDVNHHDEIWWTYIKFGPYQMYLPKLPEIWTKNYHHSFQPLWFKLFLSWLKYLPNKDVTIFYLSFFLFNKLSEHPT